MLLLRSDLRAISDFSQIEIEREYYKKQIQILKNKTTLKYQIDEVFNTNIFYLPYHNMSDDKIILEELNNTLSKIKGLVNEDFTLQKKTNSSSNNHRLKVGICSEFLTSHHVVRKLYIKVLLDLLKTCLLYTSDAADE